MGIYLNNALTEYIVYSTFFFTKTNNISRVFLHLLTFFHIFIYFLRKNLASIYYVLPISG